MNLRLLSLALLLAALVAGLVVMLGHGDPAQVTGLEGLAEEVPVAPSDRGALPSASSEAVGAAIASRMEAEVEALATPSKRVAQKVLEESVVVRVRVEPPPEAGEGLRASFRGLPVHLQTWDEQTDETFAHQASLDARCSATFEFPEAVHIDWFRFEPPLESGLALAFIDPHEDYEVGVEHEVLLEPEPGGRLRGTVVYADGMSASGLAVHAYREESGYNESGLLGTWYPPHLTTATDRRGAFEFPNLSEGVWFIAVPPIECLQFDPDLVDGGERSCQVEVLTGETTDAGIFRVLPLTRLRVQVTDVVGRPVEGIEIFLSPRDLRTPELLTLEQWEEAASALDEIEDEDLAELERSQLPLPWFYDVLRFRTDQAGWAECRLLDGSWELIAGPPWADEDLTVTQSIEVPCPSVFVRLPSEIEPVEGRVVDEDGQGIADAWIYVNADYGELEATTESRGAFRVLGRDPRRPYALSVHHDDYIEAIIEYAAGESPDPGGIVLRKASELRLRLVTRSGRVLPSAELRILSATPLPGDLPLKPATQSWFEDWNGRRHRVRSNRQGALRLKQLRRGRYEIALYLPSEEFFLGESGEMVHETALWQTWTVSPSHARQDLVADLRGYVAPGE